MKFYRVGGRKAPRERVQFSGFVDFKKTARRSIYLDALFSQHDFNSEEAGRNHPWRRGELEVVGELPHFPRGGARPAADVPAAPGKKKNARKQQPLQRQQQQEDQTAGAAAAAAAAVAFCLEAEVTPKAESKKTPW